MNETKNPIQSSQLWTGALITLTGIAAILTDLSNQFPALQGNEAWGITVTALGAVLFFLRFKAKKPVGWTSKKER